MGTNDKKRAAGKRPVRRQRQPDRPHKRPEVNVVYTEPKVFNRNRFFLQLITVVAVVVALLLGLSIFFKAENIVVSGAEKYSAWQIRQASGIQDGENLLTVNAAKVSGRIRTKLPYVDDVRVGIKLPDTVCIEIDELDVAYAAESKDGKWWLIDSGCRVVESISAAQSKSYTQILGVQLDAPVVGKTAVAAEPEPETTATEDTTEPEAQSTPATPVVPSAPVAVRGSDRLNAAMLVVQALEENGILGQVVSVDVTGIGSIELWYGDRYQIQVGDTQRVDYKIRAMKMAIEQSSEYQSGILDVSFTIWPDQVGYTPF